MISVFYNVPGGINTQDPMAMKASLFHDFIGPRTTTITSIDKTFHGLFGDFVVTTTLFTVRDTVTGATIVYGNQGEYSLQFQAYFPNPYIYSLAVKSASGSVLVSVGGLPSNGYDIPGLSLSQLSALPESGINTLFGSQGIEVYGNDYASDVLAGTSGADKFYDFGTANDIYVVDNANDQISDYGGNDTVRSYISYTLPYVNYTYSEQLLENLELLGTASFGGGNDYQNSITGNAADNHLAGYLWPDTIRGGMGNDLLEGGGGFLTDSSADNLFGEGGNDTLDGGAGGDYMAGGPGNDTYVVDDDLDAVVEIPFEGMDTVGTSVSYTLASEVEILKLTANANINGTGNGLDNVLIGNAAVNMLTGLDGNDLLDGGAGNDQLDGGNGNDIFVVDSLLDVVTDGAGVDAVVSSVNWILSAEIENLTLIGSALNGTGNAGGNLIIGNVGNNILMGLDGDDVMYGGDGNDSIQGDQNFTAFSGNDVILSEAGDDVVFAGPGDDVVALGAGFDVAIGEGGNDAINSEGGNDAIDGGDGNDTLLGWDDQDILFGANGNDILFGGNGDDIMMGNRGDPLDAVDGVDLMFGDAGQDTIHGGAGNDGINGGSGNDVIDGGIGSDNIVGGLGVDILLGSGINPFNSAQFPTGTPGNDLFIYYNLNEAGDSIYGFDTRAGNEDKLFLQPMIATFTGVATNTLAGLQASGYLRLLDIGADVLVQVDTSGGGDGYTNLVTLVGVANISDLTAANFAL